MLPHFVEEKSGARVTEPYQLGWWGGGQGLQNDWTDEERSIVSSWSFMKRLEEYELNVTCEVSFAAKMGIRHTDRWSVEYPLGPRKTWRAWLKIENEYLLEATGSTVSMSETLAFLNVALAQPGTIVAAYRKWTKYRVDVERNGEPFATVFARHMPTNKDLPPGKYTYRVPGQKWAGLTLEPGFVHSYPLGELDEKKLDEAVSVFDSVAR